MFYTILAVCILYIVIVGFGVGITNKYLGEDKADSWEPIQYFIWIFFPITIPIAIMYYSGKLIACGLYELIIVIKRGRVKRRENVEKAPNYQLYLLQDIYL